MNTAPLVFADDRPLSTAAADVLRQLFVDGPTYDGDLCSKSGRVELAVHGLAHSQDGWNTLTEAGFGAALTVGLGPIKAKVECDRAAGAVSNANLVGALQAAINGIVFDAGGEVRAALLPEGHVAVAPIPRAEGLGVLFTYVPPAPAAPETEVAG